ncbi:autophagy-related protein 3-like [Senna tora]|uniref:Autophagy-related protein 3-like n=1 Tax=Senna tora TaxID=362788 RepID=A0A834THA5_9FABA|nr:autophagy-related protein 3-like [Senna tora]
MWNLYDLDSDRSESWYSNLILVVSSVLWTAFSGDGHAHLLYTAYATSVVSNEDSQLFISRMLLQPELVLEDVSQDHARKTVLAIQSCDL